MEGKVQLNGSFTQQNNFLWGAALTLAWKNLSQQIIKQPIKVVSKDQKVLSIANNFNGSPCDFKMMSKDCFYAKAGFGNKTVREINQQVKKKFPEKTTTPIQQSLPDDGIISYAYFLKKLMFDKPFEKKKVRFNDKLLQGFMATTKQQKLQILIHEYNDADHFIIELKTKSTNDHVFLLKTNKNLQPEEAVAKIQNTKKQDAHLSHSDVFEMPKIQVKHKRTIKQLIGIFLANENFKQYYFSEVYQIINLDLDEKGVKVQNQGVIKLLRCGMPIEYKKFILDKPFWIVMCENQKYPYFVAHINHLEESVSP